MVGKYDIDIRGCDVKVMSKLWFGPWHSILHGVYTMDGVLIGLFDTYSQESRRNRFEEEYTHTTRRKLNAIQVQSDQESAYSGDGRKDMSSIHRVPWRDDAGMRTESRSSSGFLVFTSPA